MLPIDRAREIEKAAGRYSSNATIEQIFLLKIIELLVILIGEVQKE